MSQDPNSPFSSPREEAFDFLRGLYILLACLQHFAGILNAFGLPADALTVFLFKALTPSGDQLFLALAAFNLARRSPEESKGHLPRKLKVFGLIFLFFCFEGFLRTSDVGSALTWGPMQTWMLLLAVLAVVYSCFGVKAVLILFILQAFRWLFHVEQFNLALEQSVWSIEGLGNWRYESQIDLFIGSACLGLLLGLFHCRYAKSLKSPALQYYLLLLVGAVCAMLPFLLFGPQYTVNPADLFENEYSVALHFPGILAIWGGITAAIVGAILVDRHLFSLKAPVVNWCGRHSLLVFAIHLVLFVRVIFPIHAQLATSLGVPLHNSFIQLVIYALLTVFLAWGIRRSRILELIAR